jgi:sarcosine oxidase subunit beta
MTVTADVAIIGGGLHGCSAALQLARRAIRVVVIEKDHVGRHASAVNAGGVRRLGRHRAEIPLSVAAHAMWRDIEGLVDDTCGFHATGQIKVAETPGELEALDARAAQVRALGFDHETIIDRQILRDLLPAVSPHCIGGMFVAGDGYADPARTTAAFHRKARALGVKFIQGVTVSALARRAGIWRLATDGGAIEAPVILNCAGAWADRIAACLGEAVPLEVKASMLMVSAPMPRFVTPVVGAQGRKLSFKQAQNGTVIIGGGQRGVAFRDENRTTLDFSGLARSARTASLIFPIMKNATLVRAWAGLEAFMPDGIPVIGPSAAEGAYHAFGFSGHGFQLAPAVGVIMADLITARAPHCRSSPSALTGSRPNRLLDLRRPR